MTEFSASAAERYDRWTSEGTNAITAGVVNAPETPSTNANPMITAGVSLPSAVTMQSVPVTAIATSWLTISTFWRS